MSTKVLDDLLKSRFHGASNIRGVRYQLLYSLLRVFDLYSDKAPEEVQFEGLEDVDLKGMRIGNEYCQVKSSRNDQSWSWLTREKIFDHFITVFQEDQNARFVVVTNFAFKSGLNILANFCNGQRPNLPKEVQQDINKLARKAGLNQRDISSFLKQVSFQRLSEEELLQRLHQSLIRAFAIDTGNHELYVSRLLSCAITWAADRQIVHRQEVEAERLKIQDWISRGIQNPAVLNRSIYPLLFESEQTTSDYYEGKNARPGHITAALDAPRPQWQQEIAEKLERVSACIIKASSGQGKSTLLYRYAFDHFIPDTIYRINGCASEDQVGQIIDYLTQRLLLGLPLLVLVDNLSFSTRLWHRIAAELAGQPIHFLIAAREEDWYRYGQGMSGFTWDTVEPRLSVQEAQAIFHYFQQHEKIAPNVPSAEWAYEHVADKKLLIEFVYLVTHGQMLAERILDQIKLLTVEDAAKTDILRLIATAQVYDARVRVDSLLISIRFQQDPQLTLQSLEHEYITCTNGECEGLHLVRSEHLLRALHDPLPITFTVSRLMGLLDHSNLVPFVSSTFSDSHLEHARLVQVLLERCRDIPLAIVNQVIEALFFASEVAYFQAHKHLFDAAIEQIGLSSVMMLIGSSVPTGDLHLIEDLAAQFSDRPAIQYLLDIVPQIQTRSTLTTQQHLKTFLSSIISNLPLEVSSLADVARLSTWYIFLNVSAPSLDVFFCGTYWETALLQRDEETISLFLDTLYSWSPNRYREFVSQYERRISRKFKLIFEVVTFEVQGQDVYIEFIVDHSNTALGVNDQAVTRLQHLRRWFREYNLYCSQGIYAETGGLPPAIDDSLKRMRGDTLDMTLQASKNALYSNIVHNHYASHSAFEWIEHWAKVRKKMLAFVRSVIAVYEDVYQGRQSDQQPMKALAVEVDALCKHAPDLPVRLAQLFEEQQKSINTWLSSAHSFVQQFFQHDPNNGQQQMSHLMRHNLKDAIKKLPEMHQAFAAILQVEVDHAAMPAMDKQEVEVYSYLADILDYWFAVPTQRVPNLRRSIQQWREQQRTTAMAQVQENLAPLNQAGMTFLYPTVLLDEHPLTGLCIAYEVMDFEQIPIQLEIICRVIVSLDFNYTFLYLIPVVNKHLAGSIARIGRDTLPKLLAGETTDGVYPVPPPQGLTLVLPDLNLELLDDAKLVYQLGVLLAAFMMERNKLFFAETKLDSQIEEESLLKQRYSQAVTERTKELQEAFDRLLREAWAYQELGTAQEEWRSLWEHVVMYVQALADVADIPAEYTPVPAIQHPEIDQLFHKYMNRKYREL
jgi:hypothetical protein